MASLSPIAYDRHKDFFLRSDGTGFLISFTTIHAPRRGYKNPLIIGLVKLERNQAMIQCQLVASEYTPRIGMKVRLVLRRALHVYQHDEPLYYMLKAQLVPELSDGEDIPVKNELTMDVK